MADDIYIHPTALVQTKSIKPKTRIWAFCNILEGAIIGADVNICDHCSIENEVVIGDRVTVKNGVSLWDGMTIEDDVFIGPNAVFTNDIYPRSKVYHEQVDQTLIKKGATIGANAVIVAGRVIGEYAFIGAGAVVTKDIPAYTIWLGNPAQMDGHVCQCARRINFEKQQASCSCGKTYTLENNQVKLK